jgi:hypothetical protein
LNPVDLAGRFIVFFFIPADSNAEICICFIFANLNVEIFNFFFFDS